MPEVIGTIRVIHESAPGLGPAAVGVASAGLVGRAARPGVSTRGLMGRAVRGGFTAGAWESAGSWNEWDMGGAGDPPAQEGRTGPPITIPGARVSHAEYARATAAGQGPRRGLLGRAFQAVVARPVAFAVAAATARGVAAGVWEGARTYRQLTTLTRATGAAFGRSVSARVALGMGVEAGAKAFGASLLGSASTVAWTVGFAIAVPAAMAGMKVATGVAARTAARGTAYREALGAASLGAFAAGGTTMVGAMQQAREQQRERDRNRRAATLMDPRSYAGAATLERERYLQQREGAELRWPLGVLGRMYRGVMGKEVMPAGAGWRLAGTRAKNRLLYKDTRDPVLDFIFGGTGGINPYMPPRARTPEAPTLENITEWQEGPVDQKVLAAKWNKRWLAGGETQSWQQRQDELLLIQDPLYRAKKQLMREFAPQQRGWQPVSGQYNLGGASAVARTAQVAPDEMMNEIRKRLYEMHVEMKLITMGENLGP